MTMVERVRITISGAVQGVGFRPFIYRLAASTGVAGWVVNTAQGVIIEAEADHLRLDAFLGGIEAQKPPHARILTFEREYLPPAGYTDFAIHHSNGAGARTAVILPDLATCPDCLRELADPSDRRYRYPFTNCTHCGPRFTIIEALPYDRPNTTMRGFVMCPRCQAEYDDPMDRRFHAQPVACPECGPQLALWSSGGEVLSVRDDALLAAAAALRDGQIVAVKGLGGFHLMVDARDTAAVNRMRARKLREEKPLAVMVPSLTHARSDCEVSDLEADFLTSPEAPIVLLRRIGGQVSDSVAPGNPCLGVMLPYTPLHHLLMGELDFPIVATSGNLSGEPICTDEHEALDRLGAIADLFLVHNRPIARHVDDSIVRVAAGRELLLRRARGYAPLPVDLPADAPSLLAVGPHLKNTIAVSLGRHAILSQHIGDMETLAADSAFRRVIDDFTRMYELQPAAVISDLHPDYRSTLYAESTGLPIIRVQHHFAHVLACLAENHIGGPALGISWDGTGYGTDGAIWGGEFLRVAGGSFERLAHLMPFRLPGGDRAVREPRRVALGILHAVYGRDLPGEVPAVQAFLPRERDLILSALDKGLSAPLTTSAGRWFDGVAALIGLRQRASFEGQAAMELEFVAEGAKTDECYPFRVTDITGESDPSGRIIDMASMVRAVVEDWRAGIPAAVIAARFHNTLLEMMVAVAHIAGEEQVALTGGCFQNRLLLEGAIRRLTEAGFQPVWHRQLPPNDGSIAYGQLVAGLNAYVSGSTGQNP